MLQERDALYPMLEHFLESTISHPETSSEFSAYFNDNYVNNLESWAYCHRLSPVNRDIKMAPPCKRYRKVYTWQVSSIRHIINIAEFGTLRGCRLPRQTGE
jgi:hypothetical protein